MYYWIRQIHFTFHFTSTKKKVLKAISKYLEDQEYLEEGGEFNGEAQSDEEFAIQQQEENFSGNF